jgi:hypothetical protein
MKYRKSHKIFFGACLRLPYPLPKPHNPASFHKVVSIIKWEMLMFPPASLGKYVGYDTNLT